MSDTIRTYKFQRKREFDASDVSGVTLSEGLHWNCDENDYILGIYMDTQDTDRPNNAFVNYCIDMENQLRKMKALEDALERNIERNKPYEYIPDPNKEYLTPESARKAVRNYCNRMKQTEEGKAKLSESSAKRGARYRQKKRDEATSFIQNMKKLLDINDVDETIIIKEKV